MIFSQETYKLAEYMLSGKHKSNMKYASENINNHFHKDNNIPKELIYASCIDFIAKNAPITIEPEAKIVGATAYLEACDHKVPIFDDFSVSHTTIDFNIVLKIGLNGIHEKISEKILSDSDTSKQITWQAMLKCIDAVYIWHDRYIDKLDELINNSDNPEHYKEIKTQLKDVPKGPATNFAEAVQSLWFMFCFERLCGNWSGIGRIDEMLYPYYKKDLEKGNITYEKARELLAHFWIKGCEWAYGYDSNKFIQGSGDAQHYQNIVLAGIDTAGNEITNDITYMVLDIVDELHISDFPISIRLNENTPEKLHKRIAEVQRKGGGIIACYNETVVIDALIKFGYSRDEARNYANDGCWEAIIPGKTAFGYTPFDMLQVLQNVLYNNKNYNSFEELYIDFEIEVNKEITKLKEECRHNYKSDYPATLISLLVEDCIEKGRGYYNMGAKYSVNAIHAGGIANAGDSLYALNEMVFNKKTYTYSEYINIIKSNWENNADLQIHVKKFPKYGNDNKDADEMTKRIYNSYVKISSKIKELDGVLFPAGISTFGREIDWSKTRRATLDGHLEHEILASNMSPNPGSDIEGPTSTLKSYCKLDFTNLPNIGTLELKLLPESVKGDNGLEAIVSLNKSLVKLGGCFTQIDVVDTQMLLDAQKAPDKYPNLAVRISGWSARFATLDKDWQNMIINRTQQYVK